MELTLVVLAAGLGSRYGGPKQLDVVGPGGETILEDAVADAMRAGFRRMDFAIRCDLETEFRRTIGRRPAARVRVAAALRDLTRAAGGLAEPGMRTALLP
jgi:CTP:molybdopterin cytidylyltransferase MocA